MLKGNRWMNNHIEENGYMRSSSYDYQKAGTLVPGQVERKYLYGLVEICEVTNPKMVGALEQVLVAGMSRKDACKEFGVAESYFSIKVRRLQGVSILLQSLFSCAQNQGGGCPLYNSTDKHG